MDFPGQPEKAPSWYRLRQNYIETRFSNELHELADAIQAEHWFGNSNYHSRYRVDFLLKDARLIVELDGQKTHSSQEDRQLDAVRQRYLVRAGYSVVRFTGREVVGNLQTCVDELRTIYFEKLQLRPAKYRAMYIDHLFFQKQMQEAVRFYSYIYKTKKIEPAAVDLFIPHAIEWLHEKSFVTAFVFIDASARGCTAGIDGKVQEYAHGEVRINIIEHELYSVCLGNHLKAFAHFFDEFYLIGDDPIYIEPLSSVLRDEMQDESVNKSSMSPITTAKILRKGNHETCYVGSELVRIRWQNIFYPIGTTIGLSQYEL